MIFLFLLQPSICVYFFTYIFFLTLPPKTFKSLLRFEEKLKKKKKKYIHFLNQIFRFFFLVNLKIHKKQYKTIIIETEYTIKISAYTPINSRSILCRNCPGVKADFN